MTSYFVYRLGHTVAKETNKFLSTASDYLTFVHISYLFITIILLVAWLIEICILPEMFAIVLPTKFDTSIWKRLFCRIFLSLTSNLGWGRLFVVPMNPSSLGSIGLKSFSQLLFLLHFALQGDGMASIVAMKHWLPLPSFSGLLISTFGTPWNNHWLIY